MELAAGGKLADAEEEVEKKEEKEGEESQKGGPQKTHAGKVFFGKFVEDDESNQNSDRTSSYSTK